MADLKVTNALINDLFALQKAAVSGKESAKKAQGPPKAEAKPADEAARVGVDPRLEKLAEASLTPGKAEETSAITEQAARLLALDVRQSLRDHNLSFAGESEKTILSLFG